MTGVGIAVPLKFEIGARTLWSVRRRLVRVPLSLDAVLAGALPALPPVGGADGYAVSSLPQDRLAALLATTDGMLCLVRQSYTRWYVDLGVGFDAWWEALSGNTRSGLKRKAKRLAAASGGTLDVRRYGTSAEVEEFHALARVISARTYQEKLLDAGLPDTPAFRTAMLAGAAAGTVRGWLLCVDGEPAAYLYCPIAGATAIYAYLGHDPRFADLSPGSVLQVEALRDLFADPAVARFDFTEGEGQHKRGLASDGVACVDILLLRPTAANRATIAALTAFDGVVALVKRTVERAGLGTRVRRLLRG